MIAAGWPRNPPIPSAFVNNQTQVIANPIELGQGAETVLTQFKDDRPLMNTPEALSKLNSASHGIYQNDNRKFNRSTSQLPLPIRTQNMVKDYFMVKGAKYGFVSMIFSTRKILFRGLLITHHHLVAMLLIMFMEWTVIMRLDACKLQKLKNPMKMVRFLNYY